MNHTRLVYILLLSSLCHCTRPEEAEPLSPDYFPTSENSRWEYTDTRGNTFITQALGDTLIDAKTYAKLGMPQEYVTAVFRKEKGRYYSRMNIYGLFREEIMFLRDDLPAGSAWSSNHSPGSKEVYTIVAKDAEREVDGVIYKNTIEVRTDYYYYSEYQYKLSFSQSHIYAAGIGRVRIASEFNTFRLTQVEIN
jgi:hypothetical protein